MSEEDERAPSDLEGPPTLRAEDVARELSTPRAERVLVVDDDQAIVDAMVEILRGEGYQVRTASDGLQALEKILRSSAPPDVVFLDMGLPVLSGRGVIACLLETHLALLPIVCITGRPDLVPDSIRTDRVYTKPINLEQVLAAARANIAQWRATPRE